MTIRNREARCKCTLSRASARIAALSGRALALSPLPIPSPTVIARPPNSRRIGAVLMRDRLPPMTGEQIAPSPRDGCLSPVGGPGHRRAGMADHHPVTPSGRGRGHHPFRQDRSLSRARRMAGPHSARGPHGRGHSCRRRHATVPSQRPAASRRLRPGLRALARCNRAEMPPGRVAGAGTAIGTRCAGNHAHGPHGALPGPSIRPVLKPPAGQMACPTFRFSENRTTGP